jgi:hypothetical protein
MLAAIGTCNARGGSIAHGRLSAVSGGDTLRIIKETYMRRRPPMMNVNKQDREGSVTPPRSEGSLAMDCEMLRCAQHDNSGVGR